MGLPLVVVVAIALVVGTSACGSQSLGTSSTGSSRAVTKTGFHGTWPFTVDSGILGCDSSKSSPGAVFFNVDGKLYGLNGQATPPEYLDLRPIWKRDRTLVALGVPDARVSVGDMIDQGLKLCGR